MFNNMRYSIFLIIFLLLYVCGTINGQTIKFSISLEMERLLPQEQEILRPLPQQLEDYVNNFDWSDENKEVIIECTANLIIETMSSRGSEKIYRSQFLISSPSGENYYDKSCEFVYQQGQGISHSRAIFDPLLSLIDYYVYMVLGGEMDTWLLRGGSKYYNMALNIANEGSISNYSTGWKDRIDAVKLITDSDHIPLREAKFYYYDCLYYIEAKKDQENAIKLSRLVLDNLKKVHQRRPNSPALKRFFDSHFKEICSLFIYTNNTDFAESLSNMDPRHSDTYRACADKRI